MAYDAHLNFAVSAVATAPSPATSGTSLVVTTGQGTRFPNAPFNATIWPGSTQPDPSNAEIVRVTAVSTDTLTITRAQEGSTARTIVVGDQIEAGPTAKTVTDIEANAVSGGSPSTQEVFADSCGSGSKFLSTSATFAGNGVTVEYDSTGNWYAIMCKCSSTAASYASAWFRMGNMDHLTDNPHRMIFTVADLAPVATGEVFWGMTSGALIDGAAGFSYSTLIHAGIKRIWSSSTVTTTATIGNGSAATTTTFTPTNNNTLQNTFTIERTATPAYKIYDKTTLVATLSTNVHSYSGAVPFQIAVCNKNTANTPRIGMWNFNLWRAGNA